jgi:predicted ATP-binding protein involved in virulence
MIKSLRIRNFRNHKNTVLKFGELTAIAGPNGVGKSNALRALLDFSIPNQSKIELNENTPTIKVESEKDNAVVMSNIGADEWVTIFKTYNNGVAFQDTEHTRLRSEAWAELKPAFEGWIYLKPSTHNLSPSYSDDIVPVLEVSGAQLASVITHMMTSDPTSFDELRTAFSEIIPNVVDIRSTRQKVYRVRKKTIKIDDREVVYDDSDEVIGDNLLFDTKTKGGLTADQMSEGTLLILVIVTALFQSKKPKVLLIDDLDCGLHPKAQEDIIRILRGIIQKRKNLQIIFTTHSPYILNGLKSDEINILTADENGFCRADVLSEHPRAQEALKYMSTGELWSAEGEAWVLDSVF